MKFDEFLKTEFAYPEEISKENKIYMTAAWNQAVACCRKEVRKMIGDSEKPELARLFNKLDDAYWRGEDNGN